MRREDAKYASGKSINAKRENTKMLRIEFGQSIFNVHVKNRSVWYKNRFKIAIEHFGISISKSGATKKQINPSTHFVLNPFPLITQNDHPPLGGQRKFSITHYPFWRCNVLP